MRKNEKSGGFTLIELMIVTAIIGLLSAITLPKFAQMVQKAQEASIKGKLGTLRSALSLYYADNEGFYPSVGGGTLEVHNLGNVQSTLIGLLKTKFLPQTADFSYSIPRTPHSKYAGSSLVQPGLPWDPNEPVGDTGGLFYVVEARIPPSNMFLVVKCTHQDLKGVPWSKN